MQINKVALSQQPDFDQEKSNNSTTGDGFNELLQLLMNMNLTGMAQQNMPELSNNQNTAGVAEEGQQLLLNNPLNAELLMDAKAGQIGELDFVQDMPTEKENKALNNNPLEVANQLVSQEVSEGTIQPVSNVIQDNIQITQSQQMPQNLQQVAAATNQVVQTAQMAADIKQALQQGEPVQASPQEQQELPEELPGNVAKEDGSFTKISLTDQQQKGTDQQAAKSNTDTPSASKTAQEVNLPEGEGLQQRLEAEHGVKVNQPGQRPQAVMEVPLSQLPDRVAEMVRSMMLQRSPGSTSLKMKLQPEHLGEVTVKLTWSKGELSAQFVAATSMAKEALETSFPQLKQLLAQQNIQLSEAAVFMEQDTGKWQQQGSQDSHSRWEHQSRFKVQAGYPLPDIAGLEQDIQPVSVKTSVNIVV
ncbi:flagellar hook-length control protein FliK [Desulforamulus aeronauticus]|uniref:Flagellar hook-length control protein FliK n=1 Tax=Desulforamulus aeronauticus DSM 10349 TaxID=1121421 RepID=A0A1M6RCX1_9FIRM|nr:flagellar hook-length control protein FliK [Desulforamulus aeronauticus]SHK30187.1 flagellar hook-length control protein FliK [Desulforamulus aeronauticus DSM 10349]